MQIRLPKQKEQGQSLVELALVLVFIIFLVVGIVDLGRVLFYDQSMRDAAQEAVAYAAAFPLDTSYHPNCDAIKDRVTDNVADIDRNGVSVEFNTLNCDSESKSVFLAACTGNQVTVTANKNGYPLIMPLIGGLIGQAINLSASATATIIQPMCQ